jgi:alcohol dehydrogenase
LIVLAARLDRPGDALAVKAVSTPAVPAGGVRVRVCAAQVLPFSHAVLAGGFPFELPTPYTFGSSAVGVVEELADDAVGVAAGDLVFCDPYVADGHSNGSPARLIIGWFALDEAARGLQRRWRDGAFAEQAVYPAECCTRLEGLDRFGVKRLACLNYLNIAYGGLRRGGLRPGQTLIITGATGNLGTGAVLVGLAMGVARVIAAGRNEQVLADLVAVDPERVRCVTLTGDQAADSAALSEAARAQGGTGAQIALDCVGLADRADHVQAAVDALTPGGCLVAIGGVAADVCLDYQALVSRELCVRGAFMGPRHGPRELAAMARAGLLRLDALRPRGFPLGRVQEAIEAAREGRGLQYTVLDLGSAANQEQELEQRKQSEDQ